ncbi:MAG: hypothetical protein JST00_31690 [Deltaproteobacteria bacterium]|nr:hypothetical protein [Deltaproteobacteria bacterium]
MKVTLKDLCLQVGAAARDLDAELAIFAARGITTRPILGDLALTQAECRKLRALPPITFEEDPERARELSTRCLDLLLRLTGTMREIRARVDGNERNPWPN